MSTLFLKQQIAIFTKAADHDFYKSSRSADYDFYKSKSRFLQKQQITLTILTKAADNKLFSPSTPHIVAIVNKAFQSIPTFCVHTSL